MSELKENYWSGVEEFLQDEAFVKQTENEFFDSPVLNELSKDETPATDSGPSRRDFLKYLGFSVGAATIAAGCETPIRKAIPYVVKPDSIVPGIANYYATTFIKGNDVLPIVVKTREGRPIKIEGNTLSKFSNGGTSARAQSSVLDLYDTDRLKQPGVSNSSGAFTRVNWDDLDKEVMAALTPAARVVILSNSITSPSTLAVINSFKTAFPSTRHIQYDPVSSSAILLANERSFAKRVIPGYKFDQATLVVNFGADFLGTWISPVEYAAAWSKTRKLNNFTNPQMSRLIQYESNMSYTGANADNRLLIRPSEQGLAIAKLFNAVAAQMGGGSTAVSGSLSNAKAEKSISVSANDLVQRAKAGQATLVISDSNNVAEQMLINKINDLLGNYGKTIDLTNHSMQRQGIDRDMLTLINDMNDGSVDMIIVLGDANPAFDLPEAKQFADAYKKVKLRVTCAISPNETSAISTHSAPDHHFLESWGDAQPRKDVYLIMQPTIQPLYNTRQAETSLLKWSGNAYGARDKNTEYQSFVQDGWKNTLFSLQQNYSSFQTFWDNTLHDGILELSAAAGGGSVVGDAAALSAAITQPGKGVEIKMYEPIGVGSGAYANNPWLQEMPDPITRSVWNSLVHIPLAWNGDNKFEYYKNLKEDGLLVSLSNGKVKIDEIPVVRQFGQMKDTLALPLGYGRTVGSPSARKVGKYAYNFLGRDTDGNIQYWAPNIALDPTGGKDKHYASVQHHHTLGVKGMEKGNPEPINVDEKAVMTIGNGYQGGLVDRSILRSADVSDLKSRLEDLKKERENANYLNNETLYPGFDHLYKQGHHWGLSIDTNACTGCGACQVACISENNVPIVGKEEVHRHHEMTWLRIDRYYYGDVESPNVFYQPMMCQHCDNAPCENVCPVNATNHSAEGLNQMAYNRCVGTRYCANNCPYKVRRFNWADYTTADLFAYNENNPMPDGTSHFYEDNIIRMVLNPDVTVRSRGVIEKCSFCIQRIQEGKLKAKLEKRDIRDGDIKTACVSACPTGAIQFGDQNKKDGLLQQHWDQPTTYFVLEEINTRSKVGYKMKVTNKNKDLA